MVVETNTHVIYSAVFGDYDNIVKPDTIHDNVDYVLFTDHPDTKNITKPWRGVHVDWFDTTDIKYKNRRAARHFKALPHAYMPEHHVSVWMDMTHQVIMHPHLIEQNILQQADIALFKHEVRSCVYTEAAAVVSFKFDHVERVVKQIEFYKQAKYPADNGLWETPGMVRRNCKIINKANLLWWEMMCRFSSRDQISLPYILAKYKITPAILPGMAGKCSRVNNDIIRQTSVHRHHAK